MAIKLGGRALPIKASNRGSGEREASSLLRSGLGPAVENQAPVGWSISARVLVRRLGFRGAGRSNKLAPQRYLDFEGAVINLARVGAPTSEQAWELFCEWTQSDSLRKHVLAVEAAMRAYARKYGEDEELWAVTGILHDLDYERYPDLETGHPRVALELFAQRGYPRELIDAVGGHAAYLGIARETLMARALFAVDELTGFIIAVALVRPAGIVGMTAKSVKKKLKQPSFAAAVNREELRRGADELGEDFDEHLSFVIAALVPLADTLGIAGS
jgi:putative nucleotidyltransferase with HDIG domain